MAVAGLVWLDFSIATKGTGLAEMCGALGVSPEETAAFGDNWNDQAMLDMVALNLGCALHLLEGDLTLKQGVAKARDAIAQGAAAAFFKDVFHA